MQLATTLLTFLVILLFLLIWGWTILRAYQFIWRREPDLLNRLFWLALVIVLPLVGYVVFRVAFSLGRVLAEEPAAASPYPQTLTRRPERLPPAASTDASQRYGFWFTVVAGPAKGQQQWIDSFPAVIGRGAEAAVRLDADSAISRQQAEIDLRNGRLEVRDMGSRHGTKVNGKPVRESALEPGDRLEIGTSIIVIQTGGAE